jgi:hypothetical protein
VIEEELVRSSWGFIAASMTTENVIVAVVIALVLALLVWVVLHLVVPAYDSAAAIATFLLVLVALLFL